LLLPLELPGLLGLLLGPVDFLEAVPPVEPVLELPLAPDGLELGEDVAPDDVAPPEADLPLSRSHPV